MQKIFTLLISSLLLVGCVESMALLGPASSIVGGGNVAQSTVSSAINYGVKKKTGKSPMQHALSYAEKKNPNKEKKRCISFIEKTNSEACAIAKKQIALTQTKIKKKTKNIFKKISLTKKDPVTEKAFGTLKISRGQAFTKARKEGKDNFVYNGKIYNTKFKNRVAKKVKGKIYLTKSNGAAKNFFHGAQIAIEEKSKIKYLNQQP